MFPARIPGAALLILRLCIAGLVLLSLAAIGGDFPLAIRIIVAATAVGLLCLGLFTPIICLISVLVQAVAIRGADPNTIFGISVHVAMTICLLLLGPGAYSLDAKRYGRRLILPRTF